MRAIWRWIKIVRSRFSKAFAPTDLHSILSLANPAMSLSEKLEWFDSLLEWIRLPIAVGKQVKSDHLQSSRFRFLLQFLDRNPELKKNLTTNLQSILTEANPSTLFTDSGIEIEYSFTKELLDRSIQNLIPRYRDPRDLRITFERIFQSEEDVDLYKNLTHQDHAAIETLLFNDPMVTTAFREKFFRAVVYSLNTLSIRLCSLVISKEVRERLGDKPQEDSPFFHLQRLFASIVVAEPQKDFSNYVNVTAQKALATIEAVYPQLETSGVSIDLVYKLDAMKSILARIQILSDVLFSHKKENLTAEQIQKLIIEIAQGAAEKDSLLSFLGSNVNLIARKIVERTSETGEHYITRNKLEYNEMFRSAAGGGILTVFTTVLKSFISKLSLPLFFDGVFTGLNYSLSFIVIQLSHFTLATKTPAMTASTLAAKLKHLSTEEEADAFVEEVVCLVRSSFIAVLGNVGLVIPGAILFDMAFKAITGAHVFDPEYSIQQFKSHSPFLSLTFVYGAVTGFILWLSSIFGGWVDNWFVYQKQFEVLENSVWLKRALGETTHHSLCHFLRRNLSGFATNISLGFLLAFSGVWGKFFGLPLQVRHVTLSAGTLAFSFQGLTNAPESTWLILGGALGLFIIGLLNFSVSFSLSLLVAARARNVRLSEFPFLISRILKRMRSSPRDFFIPP